jgi:ABC-type sugar transport system ATPase subunit
MTAATAISVSGLVKTFGATRALDGLDLDVRSGEVHGFLGPNGAGKSTTMRLLTAQAIADEGELEVLGYRLPEDSKQARAQMGVVPQLDNLDVSLTVEQNLLVFAHLYRVPAGASPAPEEERGYLVLGGRVRITFSLPSTSAGSGASGSEGIRAVEAAIRRVRDEPPAAPEALTPAEWEELFLVARWFRDNPRELERTEAPEAFLRPGSSPSSGSARTRPSARAEPTGGPA